MAVLTFVALASCVTPISYVSLDALEVAVAVTFDGAEEFAKF